MSATTPHADAGHDDHHQHHRFHAHHFDTVEQQFQAGKLGMWLFLATEVLFFSGMFCAYTVYRVNHPEVFEFAHRFLDPTLGMVNTIVLLASSLSVAWAVRCAQLGKQDGLLYNLVFTMVCAGIFMGVKSVEYTLKFHEGLKWRGAYSFDDSHHPDLTVAHEQLLQFGLVLLGVGAAIAVAGLILGAGSRGRRWAFFALGATVLGAGVGCLVGNVYTANKEATAAHGGDHDTHAGADSHDHAEGADHAEGDAHSEAHSDEAAAGEAPEAATTEVTTTEPAVTEAALAENLADGEATPGLGWEIPEADPYGGEGPKFPGVFFSIYYAMTGVHAIHILAGIGVFVWIVYRAASYHFDPEYYGPVEYLALYWHLVDLIWIYLFPLLYLIQ